MFIVGKQCKFNKFVYISNTEAVFKVAVSLANIPRIVSITSVWPLHVLL